MEIDTTKPNAGRIYDYYLLNRHEQAIQTGCAMSVGEVRRLGVSRRSGACWPIS